LSPSLTRVGSYQVEREQILEYLLVREIGRPSVGREDRSVESLMEIRKQGRRSVVKIGKGVLHRFPIGPETPLIYEVKV
jgi:hypothetical protein